MTIEQGESFEIEKDFTGLALKKGEKAVFMDVVSEDGQGFFADRPGTYLATYLVTPEKGTCYEKKKKIVDRDTKEVLVEVPPKKILDMIAKLCEISGVVFDKKA